MIREDALRIGNNFPSQSNFIRFGINDRRGSFDILARFGKTWLFHELGEPGNLVAFEALIDSLT